MIKKFDSESDILKEFSYGFNSGSVNICGKFDILRAMETYTNQATLGMKDIQSFDQNAIFVIRGLE